MNETTGVSLERRAQQIFEQCCSLPEAEISPYLDKVCLGDMALRKACESLVQFALTDKNFFNMIKEAPNAGEERESLVGSVFGSYRLVEKLGSGGMADVYLGKRTDHVDVSAAIKLIKDWGSEDELLQRFRQEQAILANLQHPGIAKYMDSGVYLNSRPYFVMEYIKGEHIDKYCKSRQFDIARILKIFLKVCRTLSYAHQKLIIHRDIKPANILVNADGEPRLLDFGIAKLLDSSLSTATNLTMTNKPMTPQYSSPEQRLGATLSTASDQYSLGVVLYELVTGINIFELPADTLFDLVSSSFAIAPSQIVLQYSSLGERDKKKLSQKLSGDLDAIILKATQEEPENRYLSVQHLAEDIERYLGNKPVLARNQTLIARTGKLIQRNQTSFFVTVVSVIVILMSVVLHQKELVTQRNIAQEERARAEIERDKAEVIQEYLIDLFEVSNPESNMGNEISARDILNKGVQELQVSSKIHDGARSEILRTLGLVYKNLGLFEESGVLFKQALEIHTQMASPSNLDLAKLQSEYGYILHRQGEHEKSRELYTSSLDLYLNEALADKNDISEVYIRLATYHRSQGEYDKALHEAFTALSLHNETQASPNEAIALIHNSLGNTYIFLGNHHSAIEHLKHALAIYRELEIVDSRTAGLLINIGICYKKKQDFTSALNYFEEGLKMYVQLLGENHHKVASTYTNIGVLHTDMGNYLEAEPYYEKSLKVKISTFGENNPSVAVTYRNMANNYAALEEFEKALEYYEKDLAITLAIRGEVHPEVAFIYSSMGDVFQSMGNYEKAHSFAELGLKLFTQTVGENYPGIFHPHAVLGDYYFSQKDYNQAELHYKKAYEIKRANISVEDQHIKRLKEKIADSQALLKIE